MTPKKYKQKRQIERNLYLKKHDVASQIYNVSYHNELTNGLDTDGRNPTFEVALFQSGLEEFIQSPKQAILAKKLYNYEPAYGMAALMKAFQGSGTDKENQPLIDKILAKCTEDRSAIETLKEALYNSIKGNDYPKNRYIPYSPSDKQLGSIIARFSSIAGSRYDEKGMAEFALKPGKVLHDSPKKQISHYTLVKGEGRTSFKDALEQSGLDAFLDSDEKKEAFRNLFENNNATDVKELVRLPRVLKEEEAYYKYKNDTTCEHILTLFGIKKKPHERGNTPVDPGFIEALEKFSEIAKSNDKIPQVIAQPHYFR